ncbi:hypothetical protein HOBO_188 [Bacillus phage Hobo]|uniref:Uncharacterized protein n=2 Tax=Caeruleovirus BM15 TaxID=1985178 RepID=A0A0S2MUQ1_9CAUD|nr:hypothetical protein FD732_gp153 [Bacillus phage BM15]ALO79596.1 hypothetical protein BM10_192 [Bacillus phage BM15]AXQ66945.1 hypothetical protein HOBO_188 [Bacillus phage Hobo]
MRLPNVKSKKGSLEMLQGMLKDKRKQVYGVFYTNDFFSQRYVARNHVLADEVNIEEKTVKLKIATRVEHAGLWELENTLDTLVRYEAGDIPGYDYTEENATIPTVPEPISVTKHLYSIDLVLIMKEPSITYQSFSIAGVKFLMINILHVIEDDGDEFEQKVSLLFSEAGKLSVFSHLYNKELTPEDIHMLLHLIMDKNITGKEILGVRIQHKSGTKSVLVPADELISTWIAAKDSYVFSAGLSYIDIPYDSINTYTFTMQPNTIAGHQLELENEEHTLHILMEN